ncbi:spermatogenic leucine zipper protein 1 [Grammomys surdaster]|uniref:spermatogenic leucine zipper protein 1 n=1 Tax=Grammomys surdaster TaxID=491861 RepID=UPI00109FB639|nr:spermatogenic leucine zipper protein 1 [Grammomys surdaster]
MADTDSSAEMLTRSPSPNPSPGAKQEPPNSGITISLLEIGSLPTFCYSSFPPPKNSICPVGKRGKVQKFSNLLKDVKDVLKNIAGFEEKTTVGEPFEDAYTPEDLSEFNVRGVDKRNKIRFKDDLFINFDPEREQDTTKQGMLLKNQSTKNMVPKFARDLCNSEEKRCCDGVQLSVKKRRNGSLHLCGEYRKLRNNMEQLLQEADHWSRQHNELSELMRSYQECQKDIKEPIDNDQACSQTNKEPITKQKLEAQVKKLSHDTHSLHLIAALLENECQILQQRVDILREFHLHEAAPGQEKPLQMSGEQDKKCLKLAEADKTDASKHTPKTTEGTITRKPKIFRSPDDCLTKKARNNRFNARVAKKSLVGKRRTVSSFR